MSPASRKTGSTGAQPPDELGARRGLQNRRRRVRYAGLALLILATTAYTVWSIFFVMATEREEARLAFLRVGGVRQVVGCELVPLQAGTEVRAPAGDLLLLPLVEEGGRLAHHAPLALLVPPDLEREAWLYRDAREAFLARQFSLGGLADPSRFQAPLSAADSRLRHAIRDLAYHRSGLESTGSLGIRADTLRREFQLARVEGGLDGMADGELARLAAECESLIVYLKADPRTLTLRAPITGEVHFGGGGWPDEENVRRALKEQTDNGAGGLNLEVPEWPDCRYERVSQGELIATVRRFGGWPALARLDLESIGALSLRKGSRLSLNSPSGTWPDVSCRVEKLEESDAGWLVLLFCEGASPPISGSALMKEVALVSRQATGLRVPVASLIDYERESGKAGLRLVSGGMTRTVEVQVTASDGAHALITTPEGREPRFGEADLYVVNPWTVGDHQLID